MEFMQLVEGHIITEKKKRISQLYLTPKLLPSTSPLLGLQEAPCSPSQLSLSVTDQSAGSPSAREIFLPEESENLSVTQTEKQISALDLCTWR